MKVLQRKYGYSVVSEFITGHKLTYKMSLT